MSARPYRLDNLRKRWVRSEGPLTPDDLLLWISREVGDGSDVQVAGGVHVEWYSPITDEEAAREAAHRASADARQEQWERETYERLRAKFAAPEASP
jgi:hypothetical protein